MIVIIDYGIGNLASVFNMFKKIGVKDVIISNSHKDIERASKLLLPGVGAFDAGMHNLERSGLLEVLNKKAIIDKVPFLGICLGMQLLTRSSEEGIKKGLGWIDAETLKFNLNPDLGFRVPHMGWDYINVTKKNLLVSENERSRYYFVHSYYVKCDSPDQSIATCNYGKEFTCMINKDNIFGAQFHPEKSLRFGMKLLENFAKI